MKLIYYPAAFLLSKLYCHKLKNQYYKTSPSEISQETISRLIKTIKTQLFSPKRNGFLDLSKQLIAAYFIKPGDMVIDAGAYIGNYTSYYLSLVGPTGHVHAYEAHPTIFRKLNERYKNHQSVSCHNFAVSNQGNQLIQMRIYPDEIQYQCATVEQSLMNSERMPGITTAISVSTKNLNTHLDEKTLSPCSFIKIDVEGHEHAVIEGAQDLIHKNKPVILYENGYEPGIFEPRTILQMEKLGYSSYDCQTLLQVKDGYLALQTTDLVAIPKIKQKEFEELASIIRALLYLNFYKNYTLVIHFINKKNE